MQRTRSFIKSACLLLLVASFVTLPMSTFGQAAEPEVELKEATQTARDLDPDISNVRQMRNEALRLNDKRDYKGAIDKHRETLTIMHDRVFGAGAEKVTKKEDKTQDAALYTQLLNDYGSVLIRAKQYDEAIDVLEDAVAMVAKIYDESHPSYGLSLKSLGEAYMAKKEYEEAVDRYKKLRKLMKKGLGVNHEAYVDVHLKLVECYRAMEKPKRALKVIKKLIDDQGGNIDMSTKGFAEAFIELSTLYVHEGELDAAMQSAEAARTMVQKRDGEMTMPYAFSLNAVAGVHMHKGEVEEAYQLLVRAHEIALKLNGKSSDIVRSSRSTLKQVKNRLDAEREARKDEL